MLMTSSLLVMHECDSKSKELIKSFAMKDLSLAKKFMRIVCGKKNENYGYPNKKNILKRY